MVIPGNPCETNTAGSWIRHIQVQRGVWATCIATVNGVTCGLFCVYLLLYSLFTFNPENLQFEEKFHLSDQMTEQVMTHTNKNKKNQIRERNKIIQINK